MLKAAATVKQIERTTGIGIGLSCDRAAGSSTMGDMPARKRAIGI